MVENGGAKGEYTQTIVRETRGRSSGQVVPLIFSGLTLLFLVLAFAFFFGVQKSVTLDANRTKQRLEALERNFPQLAGQVISAQESVAELHETTRSLTEQLNTLSQKLDRIGEGPPASPAGSKLQTPVSPDVSRHKKGRYHRVQAGETLYRIARRYGISVAELCELNGTTPDRPIQVGQRLLVPPKTGESGPAPGQKIP